MNNEDEKTTALDYLYDEILCNYSEEDAGEAFDSYDID